MILLYVSLNYTKFNFFILKADKKAILQNVTGGNTPILVLKKMARYFLKISALKVI